VSYVVHRGMSVFSHVNAAVDQGVVRQTLIVAGLAVVVLALYLDVAIRHDPISVDFNTYTAAAQVGLHDGWSHIYDQGLVSIQQQQLAPGSREQPFISPPTVAMLVAPLAMLPLNTAYVVWALVGFGAFATALRRGRRADPLVGHARGQRRPGGSAAGGGHGGGMETAARPA